MKKSKGKFPKPASPPITRKKFQRAHRKIPNRFGLSATREEIIQRIGIFVTAAEQKIKETNPAMVYVDRAGHDFLLSRKTRTGNKRPYIRIEVGQLTAPRKRHGSKGVIRRQRLAFKFKKGTWVTDRKEGATVWVAVHPQDKKIYFGSVLQIARFLKQHVSDGVVQRSIRNKSGAYWNIAPSTLINDGVIQSIPLSEAPTLTEKIRAADRSGWK
jgi:hypothetical protein